MATEFVTSVDAFAKLNIMEMIATKRCVPTLSAQSTKGNGSRSFASIATQKEYVVKMGFANVKKTIQGPTVGLWTAQITAPLKETAYGCSQLASAIAMTGEEETSARNIIA